MGNNPKTIWKNYQHPKTCFFRAVLDHQNTCVAALDAASQQESFGFTTNGYKYKSLDKSVLYAMVAARKDVWLRQVGKKEEVWYQHWFFGEVPPICSKKHFRIFNVSDKAKLILHQRLLWEYFVLGMHDTKLLVLKFRIPFTCSTALHALLNGVAWLTD